MIGLHRDNDEVSCDALAVLYALAALDALDVFDALVSLSDN